jgi:hypothetical protein
MTSIRQIEANRRNALRSTGPRTEEGKRSSRANAYRHGLTAETVVRDVEDADDYAAFEAAVIADYDARTAVQRELVLRLASLLWRLRRATAVETDLLSIQAESLAERRNGCSGVKQQCDMSPRAVYLPTVRLPGHGDDPNQAHSPAERHNDYAASNRHNDDTAPTRTLTHCFLRLANLDSAVFDRLSRYEAALWRQTMQTLIALGSAR